MRLWALSDLHVGHRRALAAIESLRPRPDDWLILCGDVGDTLEQVETAFERLGPKFAQLVWVPGNHELWTLPRKSGLRGVARYQALVDLQRTSNVVPRGTR